LTCKSGGLAPPFHQNQSQKVKTIVQKWVTMKRLIHERRDATVLIGERWTVSSPNIFQSLISYVFNWHTKHAQTN